MSKLLAEFISNLAAKAGIKSDDAELLELVQNKALAIDIPDTLVSALEQNIHSLSSAESKIKNKLKSTLVNGLPIMQNNALNMFLFWKELSQNSLNYLLSISIK